MVLDIFMISLVKKFGQEQKKFLEGNLLGKIRTTFFKSTHPKINNYRKKTNKTSNRTNNFIMEFHKLGKHCSDPTCRQVDFLPFDCKFCKKTFCLDHREASAHECPNFSQGNIKAFTCPICLKVCKFDAGNLTEDDFFSFHQATDCKPENYKVVQEEKSKKCSDKGCKTKLTPLNTYQCKKCFQELCLNHRYEDQHQCKKPSYNPFANLFKPKEEINTQPMKKPEYKPEPVQPSKNCRNEMLQEQCTECGMRFANLENLIKHAEQAHF